jgi:acetyl-CoA C-acetyltransferase
MIMIPVYVVDGLRTPYIKAAAKPNPFTASDLAVAAIQPLLARQPFEPEKLDELVAGCVAPLSHEVNIARFIALRVCREPSLKAWTVQRNCASGLQAIDAAACDIAIGRYDLVIAGGTEAMSRSPLLLQDAMVEWLSGISAAKGIPEKLLNLLKFRPFFLKPVISLLKALTDPTVNLSMGQTAEKLAYMFDISREDMDKFALRSHELAIEAYKKGYFEEVTPLFDWQGNVYKMDTGIRADTTLEKLAKLKPVFDKPFGLVTAGNSSQVTDGASFLILASEEAVKKYQLPILGKIVCTTWAALDPSVMGLGPVHAIASLLTETKLKVSDIDYWEINEAFAAQVLACIKAMQSVDYCRNVLGLKEALGTIELNRLNVDGGAIAIGHPVGASGARLVLHLLTILKRNNAKRGIASLCIGGGQGGAVLLER